MSGQQVNAREEGELSLPDLAGLALASEYLTADLQGLSDEDKVLVKEVMDDATSKEKIDYKGMRESGILPLNAIQFLKFIREQLKVTKDAATNGSGSGSGARSLTNPETVRFLSEAERAEAFAKMEQERTFYMETALKMSGELQSLKVKRPKAKISEPSSFNGEGPMSIRQWFSEVQGYMEYHETQDLDKLVLAESY